MNFAKYIGVLRHRSNVTTVRVKSGERGQFISCLVCSDKENNISMVQLHSVSSVVLCVFYCTKHDGKFPYISDAGEFNFIPIEDKGFYLSKTEQERLKVDLEQCTNIAQDIIDNIMKI